MLLYIILFIYYIIMSFLEGITNSLKSGLASAHSAVDSVGAKAKEQANKATAMMQGGRRRKRSRRRRSYKGGMGSPVGCGCGSAQGGGARRGGRRTRRRGGARSLRGGARSLRGGARRGGARRGGARRGGARR